MRSRAALLLFLSAALAVVLSSPARADHPHDHPFCAQGGGQAGAASGGVGGTIPDEQAQQHFADTGGGRLPKTVLIPRHLGPRFGEAEEPRVDPRDVEAQAQFIEIDADDVADPAGGSNGSAFHGGHGGGPGGGQGGSAFFGGGDGGCSPQIREALQRPPGQRLPVTGSLSEQMGLLSALMLSLGTTLWLAARRRGPLAEGKDVVREVKPVTVTRRGREVVSRLKEQVKGPWAARG